MDHPWFPYLQAETLGADHLLAYGLYLLCLSGYLLGFGTFSLRQVYLHNELRSRRTFERRESYLNRYFNSTGTRHEHNVNPVPVIVSLSLSRY